MKTKIMEVCNQKMKKKEEKNKGFSLVELIVVIAIMAILAIVIAPQVMKYIGQSRSSVDATNKSLYKTAVLSALADEAAYKEVGEAAGDVTITIKPSATAGNPPDVIYSNITATSKFATELKEVLAGTYPLPKVAGVDSFQITITVDPVKNTAGVVTVNAITYTAPAGP